MNRNFLSWWNPTFWSVNAPEEHFDTPASLCRELLSRKILTYLAKKGLHHVLEIGCGSGTFLSKLVCSDPGISATGVDIRDREDPGDWRYSRQYWDTDLTEWIPFPAVPCLDRLLRDIEGPVLAYAIEWLDDLPAPIALNRPARAPDSRRPHDDSTELSEADREWLELWWPRPGRAVIGRTRDDAWRWLARRLPPGSVLATIDYGHTRGDRPPDGGLRAHRHGRSVPLSAGGNVTAPVAVDALAAAVEDIGAQRLSLTRLAGLGPGFWPTEHADPLVRLTLRSQEQLLRDPRHFGGFWLIAHRIPPLSGSGCENRRAPRAIMTG